MTARAQTPNAPTPHKSSAIQIAARCRQQRQLPSRRRHRSSATSPVRAGHAPQHRTLRPLTPENLLTSACTANAPSRRAPSIANPIEASSWSKHLLFRDLPHKVVQESIHPLCIKRAASAVLLSYPALCPCAPQPHFVFMLLPLFISYLHLISSLSNTLCLLSSPLLDELYCEMCKKQDLRTDLS